MADRDEARRMAAAHGLTKLDDKALDFFAQGAAIAGSFNVHARSPEWASMKLDLRHCAAMTALS